ncbi:MAG: cysteine--tRNA ligase [Bacillota bacterium]
MRVYNTLHNQKEEFKPVEAGKVSMYCCGPTTYNYIHLGNARPIVVFDAIRRYFIYRGYEVTYVQNFTDVDDKIIDRAAKENVTAKEIAEKYISAYKEDAAHLNVLPADVHPRVVEHIEEIIATVEKIIANGHAYQAGGDVYFDVHSFPEYGKLSGKDIDDLKAGARVAPGEQKHNPLDFVLWKEAKPGEPAWDSPWGKGRPGWHIECSAMSCKYLGETFDIHGGGVDLVFPHHENEIAQSKAASGGGFARYWLHNGFITIDSEKMSKSLGNFFLLRDILKKFSGDVVRFYLLSTHYRSPIDFADDKLEMAKKGLERIRNSWQLLQAGLKRANGNGDSQIMSQITEARKQFIAAMDDDFNTALAIAVIFDFCRELNSYLQKGELSQEALTNAEQLFKEFDQVLGMIIPEAAPADDLVDDLMGLIIKIRQEARARKDWLTADAIRDGLNEINIIIEDTPQGANWKVSRP